MDALPAKPVFSDHSLATEQPPKPFRVSGIISLLFGIISIGVLATAKVFFLPLLAIVFALVAFRPTRDPRAIPAGRLPAVIGATLALFFTGWAVAQWSMQTRHLSQDGEKFARNWLAVLADGQREFAFELTLPPADRQMESMSLVQYYQNDSEAAERFQAFTSQAPVQAILGATEPLEWELVGALGTTRIDGVDRIVIQFRDRSGQITPPVNVVLSRLPLQPQSAAATEADPPVAQWFVHHIAFPE